MYEHDFSQQEHGHRTITRDSVSDKNFKMTGLGRVWSCQTKLCFQVLLVKYDVKIKKITTWLGNKNLTPQVINFVSHKLGSDVIKQTACRGLFTTVLD